MTTPESVPSGMAMPVIEVDGHPPTGLEEFDGETSFVVGSDPPHLVRGLGQVQGDVVRFHEKDMEHSGKDVRVWEVRRDGSGFVAEHAAQF